MPRNTALFCASLILGSLPAIALASGAETRALGAHVHGHGALNIAVDGNTLAIELLAPGFDIVGFEHAPQSDADKAAIEAALALLSEPMKLFTPPVAAGCDVSEMHVELRGEEHHVEHAEGHDHDEEHHEEHDHDEAHEEHAEDAGHSEFHASYLMTCDDASKLARIDLGYFNAFPNAEELTVQLVTDAGARSLEASRTAAAIDLN